MQSESTEAVPEAFFWSKVDKAGPIPAQCADRGSCWIWLGDGTSHGYGIVRFAGHARVAHRVSWFLDTGAWPPRDRLVCHRCDTRRCVNPAHLFLGTHAENTADMIAKGRAAAWPRGRRNAPALPGMTGADIRARRQALGLSQAQLARALGVSRLTVAHWEQGVQRPANPAVISRVLDTLVRESDE